MKQINKIIIGLILILSNMNFAQELDGYKYVVIDNKDFRTSKDTYGTSENLAQFFKSKGYEIIIGRDNLIYPTDLNLNICKALFVNYAIFNSTIVIYFYNCKKELIKTYNYSSSQNLKDNLNGFFEEMNKLENHSYNENLTPIIQVPVNVQKYSKNEIELKSYYDTNKIDLIEGIYKSYKSDEYYKLGIVKVGDIYKAIVLESNKSIWGIGEIKVEFESTAVDGVFSLKYYDGNKNLIETFSNLEGGLLTIELKKPNGEDNNMKFLKIYPKK
jgi:hypothetical protein